MPPVLRSREWASAVAGGSLTYASTAWLLSGLTASPLLNALLPALSSVPALFPLPRRRSGYLLKVVAVILPLQQTLLKDSDLCVERLRWSGDQGDWIGTVLTGVLFPLGRALLQYLNALHGSASSRRRPLRPHGRHAAGHPVHAGLGRGGAVPALWSPGRRQR